MTNRGGAISRVEDRCFRALGGLFPSIGSRLDNRRRRTVVQYVYNAIPTRDARRDVCHDVYVRGGGRKKRTAAHSRRTSMIANVTQWSPAMYLVSCTQQLFAAIRIRSCIACIVRRNYIVADARFRWRTHRVVALRTRSLAAGLVACVSVNVCGWPWAYVGVQESSIERARLAV